VLDGSKGKRPESRTDELQRQFAEAEADRDGHQVAHDRLLEQRAEHIDENRGRLVKTVDRLVDEKQRRMLALIDELEQERVALSQAREAALWARTFPAEQAGRMPRWQTFAGGLRRVLEPLGLQAEVDAGRFFSALRGDVE